MAGWAITWGSPNQPTRRNRVGLLMAGVVVCPRQTPAKKPSKTAGPMARISILIRAGWAEIGPAQPAKEAKNERETQFQTFVGWNKPPPTSQMRAGVSNARPNQEILN